MRKDCITKTKTERLILRRLKKSDWQTVSYLRSDKKVNEFVERPSAESREKALEFIAKINDAFEVRNIYYWAITIKNNDQMIGSICLWNFSNDKKRAEVGYDLSPRFQKNGIMNESLENIIEFGFKTLNLEVIEAYTHKNNESSKRLLERNGFAFVPDKKDENNDANIIYELKRTVA
jgi:ribosomal-protein-alanine N-acetyltransferase